MVLFVCPLSLDRADEALKGSWTIENGLENEVCL